MELDFSNRSLFNRLPAHEQMDNLKWYNALFIRGEHFQYDYDRILRIEIIENASWPTDKLTFDVALRIWSSDVDKLRLGHNAEALAIELTARDLVKIEKLFSEWNQILPQDRKIILDKVKEQYVSRLKKIRRQLKKEESK